MATTTLLIVSITVINASTFAIDHTVTLLRASEAHGLVFSNDDAKLLVSIFITPPLTGESTTTADVATSLLPAIPTFAIETPSPSLLQGRRLFYDSQDDRLALGDDLSCAACHDEGDGDGSPEERARAPPETGPGLGAAQRLR